MLVNLEKLKRDIDATRDREARLIAGRVLKFLSESGIDIQAIIDIKQSAHHTRGKVKPKCSDPETGATWSGRGRTPRWLIGKDLGKFAVPACAASDRDSD
nr:H-NS histone family protein [Burkholderia anthina]